MPQMNNNKPRMTIQGRDLYFYFDTKAWLEVEKEFGSLEKMYEDFDSAPKPMAQQLKLAAITINAGARKEGREESVDVDWLAENATPKQVRKANAFARVAIIVGMQRENANDEDNDVDVVAEEIQKKNQNP